MDVPTLLWVDLCIHDKSVKMNHHAIVSKHFSIHRVNTATAIPAAIASVQPRIACFEYDYPLSTGLQALLETRTNYPSLSIILLTENHTEELAIWALRTRVWDYFVKPVNPEELLANISVLSDACKISKRDEHWQSLVPIHGMPKSPGGGCSGKTIEQRNTYPVISY